MVTNVNFVGSDTLNILTNMYELFIRESSNQYA